MDALSFRCLMAFDLGNGEISRITHVVDIHEVDERLEEGWIFVGPDPDDWARYLMWQADRDIQTIYDALPKDARRWWNPW